MREDTRTKYSPASPRWDPRGRKRRLLRNPQNNSGAKVATGARNAAPPTHRSWGLRAYQGVYVRIKGLTHIFSGLRATNTPRQTPNPPKRRPIQQKQAIFSDCHPIALHFGGHIPSSRGLAPSIGGIALHGGPTRRRHAARGLRVVQNPRRPPVWRTPVARRARPQYRLARKSSPNTAPPAALPRKSSPGKRKNAEFGPI